MNNPPGIACFKLELGAVGLLDALRALFLRKAYAV